MYLGGYFRVRIQCRNAEGIERVEGMRETQEEVSAGSVGG